MLPRQRISIYLRPKRGNNKNYLIVRYIGWMEKQFLQSGYRDFSRVRRMRNPEHVKC